MATAVRKPFVADPSLSFDEVYSTGAAFVFRSLRRLGVPESQVEDATQDVFVVVHRRLGEFEGRSKIETWLFAIALRVAKDYRRSLVRKPTVPLTSEIEDQPDNGSPERRAAETEAVRMLHALLMELTTKKRSVFILSELEQMSGPEISEALEVPLDTVYSRLRSARANFNDALTKMKGLK